LKRILILVSSMTLLMSCAPSGEGGSSGTSWFLLLFLFIPLGILSLLIYRYWTYPEDIVWTKEDIEEYNRKQAEERGEEYVGQSYVPEHETPAVPQRRYQVLWVKVKNYLKDRKQNKALEIARENSVDDRIREGIKGMNEIGIAVEVSSTSPAPIMTVLLPSGNNNREEDIDIDEIDLDNIDIDAYL